MENTFNVDCKKLSLNVRFV